MKELLTLMTELSYQYGPFLFAVLFILVISVRTRRAYNGVITREKPPATPEERKTYRRIYIGSYVFGIALVIASVAWWMFNQTYHHVYTGRIVGLKEHEKVSSPDMYFKPILHEKHPQAPQVRDEQFLVVQDEPIASNKQFNLYYSKGGGRIDKFLISCGDGTGSEYRIDWSDSLGRNVLELVSPPVHASLFGTSVFAAELEDQPYFKRFVSDDTGSSIDRDIMSTLQDERSDVGSKIAALERLSALNDELFKKILETSTPKETMIQTLLDLGRHTDRELAYKARQHIYERYNVEEVLSQRILSEDAKTFQSARKILLTTEPNKAAAILDSAWNASPAHDRSRIDNLKAEIDRGTKARALIPTGSTGGDRYYVRAEWDPTDTQVVECLTELFHGQLIHDRSLEDEKVLMAGRSERFVWWYSKEWALWIAERIEECGATASFVGY